jgi:ribokinase
MSFVPKFDVIVCGSLHLDIVVHAQALPRIDETAVGQSWKQVCGGKGGNQAAQAARHGAKTALIGRVGKDDFGQTLFNNMQTAGVDTQKVKIDPSKGSGMSVAILQSDGDYGAVIVSGANLEIDPSTFKQDWTELGGAKVLVLQNEIPHAVNVAAAKWAHEHGTQVLFNAAPARPFLNDLSAHVDILVVNRVEAEMISGMTVTDRASAIACLSALGSEKKTVIITLGGDGLVVKEKSSAPIEIEAHPVKVVSTHGAGDCFVGVLASSLAAGLSLIDACIAANAKAAAHVSKK